MVVCFKRKVGFQHSFDCEFPALTLDLSILDHSVSLLQRSAWVLYQRPLVIVQRSVPITTGTLRFVTLTRWVVPTIGRRHTTMLIVTHLQYNVDILPVRSILVWRQDMPDVHRICMNPVHRLRYVLGKRIRWNELP
jgi:hypothetical protein